MEKCMECMEIYVQGRVQGVGYRWFVRENARLLNIRGRVKNLYDGRVEIIACGSAAALASFIHILRQGTGRATVEDLITRPLTEHPDYEDFSITF